MPATPGASPGAGHRARQRRRAREGASRGVAEALRESRSREGVAAVPRRDLPIGALAAIHQSAEPSHHRASRGSVRHLAFGHAARSRQHARGAVTVLTCALGPDAAGTMLMQLVRGARRSIDAAIYEVGPSYRWALVRAAERGLRVRLVLDAHISDGNGATAGALVAAGGECRVAGVGADSAHGKLLVVDSTVAVGTGNLIWRDAPRNRHRRLHPDDPPLAGTREWWVTAAGAPRLHRAAAEAFHAHWT